MFVARWIKIPRFGLPKGCLVRVSVSKANKCDAIPNLRISDTDIMGSLSTFGTSAVFSAHTGILKFESTDEDLMVYGIGIIRNVCCVQFYTGVFIVCSRNSCCYHGFLL